MNRKLPFIIYHNEWGYDQNEVVHLKDLSPTKWTYVWKKERNRSPAWSHIYFIWTNVYFVHFKVRYSKKLSNIKDMEWRAWKILGKFICTRVIHHLLSLTEEQKTKKIQFSHHTFGAMMLKFFDAVKKSFVCTSSHCFRHLYFVVSR
jgi:hypothetical protein